MTVPLRPISQSHKDRHGHTKTLTMRQIDWRERDIHSDSDRETHIYTERHTFTHEENHIDTLRHLVKET